MNDNASFDMKAKGNGAPDIGHGVKRQVVKEGAHAFPQVPFAAGSLPVAAVLAGVKIAGGGGIGLLIARAQRKRVHRAQLALEQILDRLEHGEIKAAANPISALLTAITR